MAAHSTEAPDAGDEHEPGSNGHLDLPPSKPHSEPIIIDMTEADEGRGFVFFVNPPRSTAKPLLPTGSKESTSVAGSTSPEADVIQQALRVLESRMRAVGPLLTNPQTVRDYLRLRIADLEHEVFVCVVPRRSASANRGGGDVQGDVVSNFRLSA